MSLWERHPAVRTGQDLTFAERAADRMKSMLATWTALIAVLVGITVWMLTDGGHIDPFPWILLNLMLSCFAALQCFVLLIANRRGEQIAAALAVHDHQMITDLRQMIGCVHRSPATGDCTCNQEAQPE